jgi:hypothetical protein
MNIHAPSMNKVRLSAHRLSYFIALACLGTSLFASRVEAQTWEFKLTLTKENLCTFNGQTTGVPISISPGDEVIVQVRNNTSTKHLLRWRGVIYHGEPQPTAAKQEVSRRFYSLQKPIGAGETFVYRWKMENQGTLVYDCRVAVERAI